jgi:2-iminobutanoate/2-iminopropanoate deaminase
MPTRIIESSKILKPFGYWNTAFEISSGSRTLVTGGISGVKMDGSFDPDIEGQTKQMFQNVIAVLEAAEMTMENVVKLNTFLLDYNEYDRYSKAREPFLGERKPAVTLLVITGLPRPGLKVEVDVIAAA